jgi:uncharacterized protein with von Willebrand factor type A (vWA) domain
MAELHGARAGDLALERLVGFGRFIRRSGLPVGTGRIVTFCRSVAVLGPTSRSELRAAARATLVGRPEDFDPLDALFDRYFGAVAAPTEERASPRDAAPGDDRPERFDGQDQERTASIRAARWRNASAEDEVEGESSVGIVASDVEVIRRKDFAELTSEERRQVSMLVRRLTLSMPHRPSRRYRRSPRGDRFDLRRTIRASMRTEGEPLRRAWKQRQARSRPLVLLLDVSGSMAPYVRPLLEFGQGATRAGRRVEVFCFGTRLTRLTRALRSPREALTRVGEAVSDWEGGTRIGESLADLLDEWSTRSALRGAVVVLCSDGLERGDPEFLSRQMARLSRLAWKLIWVNPLKGSPRYEPLARGMAASLPFVDVFLSGHNLESLEALGRAVAAV